MLKRMVTYFIVSLSFAPLALANVGEKSMRDTQKGALACVGKSMSNNMKLATAGSSSKKDSSDKSGIAR